MSYLEPRQMHRIPETAAAMFSSREFYRQLVAKLELMADWYNKVVKTLVEVEFPLVEEELRVIDLRLRAAEGTLNWKTEGNGAPPGIWWGSLGVKILIKLVELWIIPPLPPVIWLVFETQACPLRHLSKAEKARRASIPCFPSLCI